MPAGRPLEWTQEKIQDIINKLEIYIDDNTIPIISEFCYQNNIRKQRLYEKEEFSDSIKRLIEKKEANLEKGMLFGKINVTGAIFSLKQLGWKDKSEVDFNSKNVNFNIDYSALTEEEAKELYKKIQQDIKNG